MRNSVAALAVVAIGLFGSVAEPRAQEAVGLQIEIASPVADLVVESDMTSIAVEGMASTIGGVRYLDMIFVMDTSTSLRNTDPKDYRSVGAVGLVDKLSPRSDIKMAVVSFDSQAALVQPMTSDRELVKQALRNLPRSGSTNLASGISTALRELEANGRPGASRLVMLFTDGESNRRKAHAAAVQAHASGVVIQTLLLGSSKTGGEILDEISWATGGSLVQVSDPTRLPEAFLNLRTTGVDSVTLSVNGSEPIAAQLAGGTFVGELPLVIGANHIVARATSIAGKTRETDVTVTVQDASCGALEVAAVKDGRPVVSLDDRAVEIVVDASRSMWGRMHGQPKMVVAKDTLEELSYWYPQDLDLALRAYGSTSPSESNDCTDSRLLVPFYEDNRESIRAAISGLRPLGQTPIAFALDQAGADFGEMQGDRALVLVTDGIESCDGDPARAASQLQQQGITVHVVGFGMGNAKDEDTASLQAIAAASGGRYVTAGSAAELKDAFVQTVATAYSVYQGDVEIAGGSLGTDKTLYLADGDYRVELYSSPPQIVPVRVASGELVELTFDKGAADVTQYERREPIEYRSCRE